jgi:beta-galactosidase GanA
MHRRVAWNALVLALGFALGSGGVEAAFAQQQLPHLRKQGTATQLVVDGAPFLILGGELGNSSASSLEYLRPIWPKLAALHLNTVVAPVYWDLTEPREGVFDFTLVDGLIRGARQHGMRLVLLWFGSWKNSMACYAPAWVKTDQARFPRTEARAGEGQEILSPFSETNWKSDAHAFATLMRHLRRIDGKQNTVVMVQVENEIGMIPEARDHSARADSLFAAPVPAELMAYLRQHRDSLVPELRELWAKQGNHESGAWQEVFGQGLQTDELFMAWWFGRYADRVAAAGKAEYPLPMYVNAALIRPGYVPGRYVSAGPLPHLLDVWRVAAPSIDFLAPDIYFPNFVEWTTKYVRSGNPLFIPEANNAGALEAAANAAYAFGEHDAIGFSPFSIENTPDPAGSMLARAYAALRGLAPLILAHQGRGTMVGVRPPVSFTGEVDDSARSLPLGDYVLNVSFRDPWVTAQNTAEHGGLIIALAPDEFLVAGTGLTITFAPRGPGAPSAGILSVQEGRFEGGRWIGGRWLNGDEDHQGRHLRLPTGEFGIQRVRLYRFR